MFVLLGLIALFLIFPAFPQVRDEVCWRLASFENQAEDYAWYLEVQPDDRYADEAREDIHNLHWQQAQRENRVVAYEHYLADHPDGQFAEESRAKIEALLQDDTPYFAARDQGTHEVFKAFLVNFLKALFISISKDVERRDLIDLLNERKVQIRTRGSRIDEVSLEIRRLVDHEITVHIPLGTLFIPRDRSVQNMVTIQACKVTLRTEGWVEIEIPVACANRRLKIPGREDTFTIARSPRQKELERLLPILQQAIDFYVKQAAIWIVTDNANYRDLGILVISGPGGGGPVRAINEDHAALAMMLVHEAGIDITKKAIWQNRHYIRARLTNEDLKRWLVTVQQTTGYGRGR